MKQGKMSESRLSGLNDEQDLGKKKILKTSNHANPDSDNMKQGWEIKKLGEVCENLDSKRIPITQSKRTKGDIPYYGASGIVDYVSDYIFDEDLLCVSEDGANLLARTYPIAFSISGKTWVNNHAHVLRFKNFSTQKFVELYLNSIRVDDYVSGMAQPKLNQAMLNKIPIPLPPLPEQQRIVSILDEAFAAIAKAKANAEQNLKNAKELFESYLQGVFASTSSATKGDGWEEKKLGEVYDVRDGTHDSPKYHNQGFPLITSKNLKNHKLTFDNIKFISETDYLNINKRSKVDVGDVLFAMIGTIGNPVVIEDDPNYAIKNVALFKVGNNQSSYFLKYFLDSKQTIEKMMRDAKGTTQKFVGLGYLRSFPILVPPLEAQQTIVRQLDALRAETQKLEVVYQKKMDDLEELKKSILQKAFAGELHGGADTELSRSVEPKTEKALVI